MDRGGDGLGKWISNLFSTFIDSICRIKFDERRFSHNGNREKENEKERKKIIDFVQRIVLLHILKIIFVTKTKSNWVGYWVFRCSAVRIKSKEAMIQKEICMCICVLEKNESSCGCGKRKTSGCKQKPLKLTKKSFR